MTPLFAKLNLGARTALHVLEAPASFEAELAALAPVQVQRAVAGPVDFVIAFATQQAALDALCTRITAAAVDDAVVWIAYPKGSSKRYRCDFNRDTGWTVLGAAGFEPVRQVAIDEDWSALRFRRVAHIETMTRNPAGAISAAGRAKAARR